MPPTRSTFLRSAGRAVASLFSSTDVPRGPVDIMTGILGPNRAYILRRTRDQSEQLRYYKDSPPFRKVTHRIGEAVAAARWHLYAFRGKRERSYSQEFRTTSEKSVRTQILRDAAATGEMTEVFDHPFLDILREGSPLLLGHLQDRVTEICYTAAGEAFWVLEPNDAGVPCRAWMIPPHWVVDVPTSTEPWYGIEIPAAGRYEIPAGWVVWFRDPDPHDPYARGVGFAASLAPEIETDHDAAEQIRLFFHQGMKPEILLMGPGLKSERAENLRQDWVDRLRGLYKRWQFHTIDAPADAQIHQLSQDFDGDGLIKLRRWDSDIIRETLGVNPEILGEVVGSNRATSYMARVHWKENVVGPRLEYRRAVYQHTILPMYQSPRPLVVEWEIPAVEDQEMEQEYATVAPWAASWAQQAARQGIMAPDGSDKIYMVPINMRPMRQEDLLNPRPPAPPPTTVVAPPPPAPAAAPDDAKAAARRRAREHLATHDLLKKKVLTATTSSSTSA